jgi:multiple sugar transport system ATP-binding protein
MAEIRMEHIKKNYGDVEVIRDFSLEIRDEELMVLVGPSGCGKSTALRMLAGLEEITGGDLFIGDKRVNETHPKDRDVAMVFQSYALYPHMSVRENIAFGLKIRKVPQDEITRRVAAIADPLGLSDLLDRKPKALSGGQRQRVALGRAIVREPSVFLFDEPLSNLDAELRVHMRSEISQLQKRLKVTSVYVTHDQIEAMTMGNRICVMKKGDLMQVGAPLELFDFPQNLFVARFIGTPPMNIMEAQVAEDGRTLHVGTHHFPVMDAWDIGLQPLKGKSVILGIRPNHVTAEHPGSPLTTTLKARVRLVEPLGHEVIVHLDFEKHNLVAKLGPHHIPQFGEELDLIVDCQFLHLFDPASEQRLPTRLV